MPTLRTIHFSAIFNFPAPVEMPADPRSACVTASVIISSSSRKSSQARLQFFRSIVTPMFKAMIQLGSENQEAMSELFSSSLLF